jgi:hypothetical protein
MSPTLTILLFLYSLLSGSGLIAFLRAARRTSEDWDQHPAIQRMEQALRYSSASARNDVPSQVPSRAN